MTYYKVVTEDLRSLGLRKNPTILTYAMGVTVKEPNPEHGLGGWGGTGGIWVANGLSKAKGLKKYMDKKKIKTKIFKVKIGNILYSNTYRSKVDSVKLLNEIL